MISFLWLKKEARIASMIAKNNDYNFILLIPVLKEQKALPETISYFLNFKYDLSKIKIILISTENEFAGILTKTEKTTIDVIKKIQKETNQKYGLEIIEHLHYPTLGGKMVDQLNYAFEHILNTEHGNLNRLFVGIYNADSRPNHLSLNYIAQTTRDKKYRVFQQSAVFLDNFNKMNLGNNFIAEKLLKANAILQTRWTFAHELPRMLMQSFMINKFKKRFFLAHCVGHGLFLRGDFLMEIKQIPRHTVTEDLFFGYVLSLLGESINPIPLLECAEIPNKLIMALKQKYVWFFGPLDHLSYRRFFLKNFSNRANRLLIDCMTFQGILPAIAWFFSGWMIAYVIIYPIITANMALLLLGLLAFIVYGPLNYLIVMIQSKILFQVASQNNKIKKRDYFWILLFSFPMILLHSIPPIFTLMAKLNYLINKKEPPKPKTER
ncbi:MAG: glycosyltransferase family 2 protein [bacterium]